MIRPQPVRRPRSWWLRIACWLIGWDLDDEDYTESGSYERRP